MYNKRMAMQYDYTAIPEKDVPRASSPIFQHLLDTYASETSKVVTVWRQFGPEDMTFKPADRSYTVAEVMKHQLLSERRFFAEFIGLPGEPEAAALLPPELTATAFCKRNEDLCRPRLARMANKEEPWWLEVVPFFDVHRQRIWVFWRRVLHTAHHRTQLSVYLRLMGKPVPPSYGPTADVTWTGADPTRSVKAAERK
ncbi:MAG TPA: DinB family protein [Candidatus Angelobacter sp.]|nr:DinB family protein [Candidatus Angelobacter sp.]